MQRKSFFGRINSHLKDKYSGRFMALILAEIAKQEPKIFERLLARSEVKGLISGAPAITAFRPGSDVQVEWCFPKGRRADLAILWDGTPSLICEVKVDDINSAHSPAQLSDYLQWLDQNDECIFVHFSRYFSVNVRDALSHSKNANRIFNLRYRDLHAIASSHDSPLAAMIAEFLEEIGVTNFTVIDLEENSKALTFLVTQMAGFPHFHGMGRLQDRSTTDLSAQLLIRLLNNMKAMGEWLYEGASDCFSQKPQSRFKGGIGFDRSKVARQLKSEAEDDDVDEQIVIDDRAVAKGWVTIFTRVKLRREHSDPTWTYVELGLDISVERQRKARARIRPYTQVYWNGGWVEEFGDYLTSFPTADDAEESFLRLVRSCVKNAHSAGNKASMLRRVSKLLAER